MYRSNRHVPTNPHRPNEDWSFKQRRANKKITWWVNKQRKEPTKREKNFYSLGLMVVSFSCLVCKLKHQHQHQYVIYGMELYVLVDLYGRFEKKEWRLLSLLTTALALATHGVFCHIFLMLLLLFHSFRLMMKWCIRIEMKDWQPPRRTHIQGATTTFTEGESEMEYNIRYHFRWSAAGDQKIKRVKTTTKLKQRYIKIIKVPHFFCDKMRVDMEFWFRY